MRWIISANTPWLVTGYGGYGLMFCTWRVWLVGGFEIWRGEAEPNFKFFHNPYFPSAEYEAIFSITRHQPGGICTNNFIILWNDFQPFNLNPFSNILKKIVRFAGASGAPWKAGDWRRLSSPLSLWAAWSREKDQGNSFLFAI